jgi:predicted DNA-binding transcriptional regulator AlpA
MKTREVCAVLNCGRTTLWGLVKKGALQGPLQLEIGPRWDRAEVENYLRSQLEGAKQERAKHQKGAAK